MSNVLMLWPDITEDIPSLIKKNYSDCVDVRNLYKKTNKFRRVIRRIRSELHLSTAQYFDDWIDDIGKYSKIIIHANPINQSVPAVLRKKGYDQRIIYWYWNPVCNCVSPKKIDRNNCELWSFSKDDCEQYNLRYNSTYYFMKPDFCTGDTDRDLFFIGADKGRYQHLMKLKSAAEAAGLTTDFRIIKDKTSSEEGIYAERLNYTQVVELVKKTKAVVELLQKGQNGFSLRVMEGLFFGKKLISDNMALTEDDYPKDALFSIEPSDYEKDDQQLGRELKDFVSRKQIPIKRQIVDYYDFRNWLSRFDEG